MKHKKGDRVEFDMKGNKLGYGVVKKGGENKITVVLDGGEHQVSGHANLFQPSAQPLLKDTEPSPMDKYSVSGYKGFESHDGGGFNAFITKNGKKILAAHDGGHGGEIDYHGIGSYSAGKDGVEFEKDVNAWAKKFGATGIGGNDGCWIEWYVGHRPYGVTSKKYWEQSAEMLTGD